MCFNFFYPPHKNFEILPTHIAHIAKAPQANASTKALSKSLQMPARVTAFQVGFRIAHAQKKQNKFMLRG
jgi:hypothetical protein